MTQDSTTVLFSLIAYDFQCYVWAVTGFWLNHSGTSEMGILYTTLKFLHEKDEWKMSHIQSH